MSQKTKLKVVFSNI